jgi:small subunit ribosomal protein S14
MARQAIIERERKRRQIVAKYAGKRQLLLEEFKNSTTLEEKFLSHKKIEKLNRNSSATRLRNRCWRTGRGRGVYQDFGLCRHMMREMSHNGLLPGMTKASW